jgi:hypothetical protein
MRSKRVPASYRLCRSQNRDVALRDTKNTFLAFCRYAALKAACLFRAKE